MKNIKQILVLVPTTQRGNELRKKYVEEESFFSIFTFSQLLQEIYEIYAHKDISIDQDTGVSIIYHLIVQMKSGYFDYLKSMGQGSESLGVIYDYFIKLSSNDVKIDQFDYAGEKKEALEELYSSYQEYKKKNHLIDKGDIYSLAISRIDEYLKRYDKIDIDSFDIGRINLLSSKKENELFEKIGSNEKAIPIKKRLSTEQSTICQNKAFDSYDEVRTAIKIAKKILLKKECSSDDIVIVTSDFSEHIPYFKNLLDEYGMCGFDTTGTSLGLYGSSDKELRDHLDLNVQKTYWKYDTKVKESISLLEHLKISYDEKILRDNIRADIKVKDEPKGILFTENNKLIGLEKTFKHIIFIGTDITHFPPKQSKNFLYTPKESEELFYTSNIFDASLSIYEELKRSAKKLYIVTASYSGKRKLTQSIILPKGIGKEFDITDIKSRNDILRSRKKFIEEDLKRYQESIRSKEHSLFDGKLECEFNNGDKLSASAINTYIKCPMQYYFGNVLKLNAPQDKQEGFDAAQRGSLIHKCFELFVEEIQTHENPKSLSHKKLYDLMLEISLKAYNDEETRYNMAQENINHKIELKVLQKGLEDINSENKSELAKFVDYFYFDKNKFEYFKNSIAEELFMLDHNFKPIDLKGKSEDEIAEIDKEKRFIKGFIDRLDNLDDVVNIIDYKSSLGSYPQKDFNLNTLKNYQLGIYMLYAMQKYQKPLYIAKLLSFKDKNYNDKISLLSDTIKENLYNEKYEKIMKEDILKLQEYINSGKFEYNNSDEDTCGYCNFKHICHQAVLDKGISYVSNIK